MSDTKPTFAADMRDYDRIQATMHLMDELAKGRMSGEEKGWLTSEDLRKHFRSKANDPKLSDVE